MSAKTLPTYEQNGVKYGYSLKSKKWEFHVEALKHTALISLARVENKVETGQKIANILAGAIKRGKIDNLARKNIEILLARAE